LRDIALTIYNARDYGAGNDFMTSPLLEWTYPKKLIKLDMVEPEAEEETGLDTAATYRILCRWQIRAPKGLLQLAVAIAGSRLQPAVVHPLSLVELERGVCL